MIGALTLKELILSASRITGITAAVRNSSWRRSRLAILCYHGVSLRDEHEAAPALYMSPATFRRRLEILRHSGFNVLSLTDALSRLSSGHLPPRSVALTFDDGTRDFAEVTVPLLQEFSMPATVYLTTYYCEKRLPVFDTAVRYLLWRGRARPLEFRYFGHPGLNVPLADQESRSIASARIIKSAKERHLTANDKHLLLRQISIDLGIDFEEFLATGMFTIMAPDQVAALPRGLVDVQLHTHRHRTPRDLTSFRKEIVDNQVSLNKVTVNANTELQHFCYPSGDYSGEFLNWLPSLGIRSATTCIPGLATRNGNPLLLPRFVDTGATTESIFDSWISGTAELLPRRRRHKLDHSRLNVASLGSSAEACL